MTGKNIRREPARRVFAFELRNSTHELPCEDDKSPKQILTPTGARCNRVFFVGALLEKEEVRPESGIWRIRVSDPTGVFVGYVGNYQPEALEALMKIEPPEMVAIVAKVRVFEGETKKFVSIRPEEIAVVDRETRDWWVYETAKRTLERIEKMESNKDDPDVALAWQVYNPDLKEYLDMVKYAVGAVLEDARLFSEDTEDGKDSEDLEEDISGDEELLEEFEEEFEEEEWDLSEIMDK